MKKTILLFSFLIFCFSCTNDPVSIVATEKRIETAQTGYEAGIIDKKLRKIYRYWNTAGDHYNSNDSTTIPNYGYEGVSWYVLDDASGVTFPTKSIYELWRVANGYGDHMISPFTSEDGHVSPTFLGDCFVDQDLEMALFPMYRYHLNWNQGSIKRTDHCLAKYLETPSGWTMDRFIGYGWPAWDSASQVSRVIKDGINIGIARAWGGAITSLIVNNGLELVNKGDGGVFTIQPPQGDGLPHYHHDAPGRLIQSAMWYWHDDNPTEAGDWWGNGSPCINFGPNLNGPGTIFTRTNCLAYGDFNPAVTFDNPILTGTEISKTVTIVNAHRIKYITNFRIAKDRTVADHFPVFEGLCAHLNTQPFNMIYLFVNEGEGYEHKWEAYTSDDTHGLQIIPPFDHNLSAFIMAQNTNTGFCFALYPMNIRPTPDAQTILQYLCAPGVGQYATIKLSITDHCFTPRTTPPRSPTAGVLRNDIITFTNYILVGDISNVINQANDLWSSVSHDQ